MTKVAAVTTRGARSILVGIDGSMSAQRALIWAAQEADSRRCLLHIVHAFSLPTLGTTPNVVQPGDASPGLQVAAEWILTEATIAAQEIAPDIKILSDLLVGPPAPTLLSQAQNAGLVVLGNRGTGGFRGLLIGSVSSTVAAHAPCPVIVAHPNDYGTGLPTGAAGRIVVGVDGSETSAAAIRFACEQAVRRNLGITAVHAAVPTREYPTLQIPPDIVEQVDHELLATVGREREFLRNIDVEVKLVHDHPAEALIDASVGAGMIVVGSRGGGGFTGILMGSVSRAVLQHAFCPTAVVRPHQRRGSGAHPEAGHFATTSSTYDPWGRQERV